MLALTRRKKRVRNNPFPLNTMAFTNLATKLLLNDKQVNSGPLGNGFPYLKFAWEVELSLGQGGEAKGLMSTGPLVAKTCELPRFSVETQVVNVYNHKTIVQTKMNYEPITMTFYDQTNNVAESLIWDFVKGQFDSPDVTKKNDILSLTVKITMKNLSGDGDDKVYTLLNAFIVDAQHDTLDYSTSDPVVWTITLRYEDLNIDGVKGLDFKGPRKGDKGAGIKALPKPPSKPSVVSVPITKPPKADANVETGPSKWVQAGGEENGPLGAAWGNPNLTKQSARHRNKTQTAPASTTAFPAAEKTRYVSTAEYDKEIARFSRGSDPTLPPNARYIETLKRERALVANNQSDAETARLARAGTVSPSTGATTPAVVNKTQDSVPKTPESVQSRKPLSAANQEFIKQESAYVKEDRGLNPEYKKAYLAELEKNPPITNSPQSRETARHIADMKALQTAPRYSSQVRTRNADGSMTDRYVPQSVNNNPSATSSQSNKEQQYVKKTNKPTDY
jgi:hypothetical protein